MNERRREAEVLGLENLRERENDRTMERGMWERRSESGGVKEDFGNFDDDGKRKR